MSRYKEEGEIRGLYLHSRREEKQRIIFIIDKSDHGWWSHRRNAICDKKRSSRRSLSPLFGKCCALFFRSRARSKRTTTAWEKILGRRKRDTKIKKRLRGYQYTHRSKDQPLRRVVRPRTGSRIREEWVTFLFLFLLFWLMRVKKARFLFVTFCISFLFVCFVCLFLFKIEVCLSLFRSLSCLSLCLPVSTIQSQPRTR